MNHVKGKDYNVVNGVVRWTSNNRVPFDDLLEVFRKAGDIDGQTALQSQRARDAENAILFRELRKNVKPATSEEIFEMRAAFGSGIKIVDVITGRVTQL